MGAGGAFATTKTARRGRQSGPYGPESISRLVTINDQCHFSGTSSSRKIAATGQCKLSIDYKGGSASLSVAVYEKPSRYDLAVKEEGGKLSLARR